MIYLLWRFYGGSSILAGASTELEVLKHRKVDLESRPDNREVIFIIEERLDDKQRPWARNNNSSSAQ